MPRQRFAASLGALGLFLIPDLALAQQPSPAAWTEGYAGYSHLGGYGLDGVSLGLETHTSAGGSRFFELSGTPGFLLVMGGGRARSGRSPSVFVHLQGGVALAPGYGWSPLGSVGMGLDFGGLGIPRLRLQTDGIVTWGIGYAWRLSVNLLFARRSS